MRFPRTRGSKAAGYIGLALGLAIGLPATWAGANAALRTHIRMKTGKVENLGVTCFYCHRSQDLPPIRTVDSSSSYLSPSGLAVSPDGRRLFATAEDGDLLLEIDLDSAEITRRIPVPGGPHAVAVSSDGKSVAVALRDRDEVVLFDSGSFEISDTVAVGREPLGLAFGPEGRKLFVANGGSDDLRAKAIDHSASDIRWKTGTEPYDVAISGDGRIAAVANRRVLLRPEPLLPASELTLIDLSSGRVSDRRLLLSAHLAEGVALSSDAEFALVPALRIRNYLPTTQVARGALMNSTLVFAETRAGGRTVQFPLDEVNAYYADPSDVVITPDDRLAFVSHGGANVVSVVDLISLRRFVETASQHDIDEIADDLAAFASYVVARIPTRENPRALAISRDGSQVFVAERLADSVATIDTASLQVSSRIHLSGPTEITSRRRGERIFHDASISFQGQFSCRSCHPDGHTDGLNWDFEIDGIGVNRLDTRSLRGLRGTAPFKWNGKNPDLATQCGPRFARVLTRSEPFAPDDLRDLVNYMESIPRPALPAFENHGEAIERGREIFFRTETDTGSAVDLAARCDNCHRLPTYTDRLKADVGTGGRFDTPHLLDIRSSAPYLHDGRAMTLEEIWTVYSPEDTHGITNDLTKVQLNDLVLFLRSL